MGDHMTVAVAMIKAQTVHCYILCWDHIRRVIALFEKKKKKKNIHWKA